MATKKTGTAKNVENSERRKVPGPVSVIFHAGQIFVTSNVIALRMIINIDGSYHLVFQ